MLVFEFSLVDPELLEPSVFSLTFNLAVGELGISRSSPISSAQITCTVNLRKRLTLRELSFLLLFILRDHVEASLNLACSNNIADLEIFLFSRHVPDYPFPPFHNSEEQ
jgi:hypothetical protein